MTTSSLNKKPSAAKKSSSRTELEGGCVLRKKLDVDSVQYQGPRIVSFKPTLHIRLYTRRLVIIPAEKREELVTILDDMIKRLTKIINSNRTKTTVRLRAMEVLTELIRASYTMVRDVEVEELELETKKLEKEAKRTETEDSTAEEEQVNST